MWSATLSKMRYAYQSKGLMFRLDSLKQAILFKKAIWSLLLLKGRLNYLSN